MVKFAACGEVCFGVAPLLFWPPPPSPPPFDLETSSRNLAPEGRTAFEDKDVAEDSSSIFDETYEVPWRLPCGQLFQLVQQLLDLGLKGSLSSGLIYYP